MKFKKIPTVRGMHDLQGEAYYNQQNIIKKFVKAVSLLNFMPISTPILENSEVFLRTLGNSSDVVMKEMYTFLDKSNESVTLRPEGTASVARSLISSGLTQNLPRRYFYYGPMFRYERPQKGRLRQFHQVGVELFGKGELYEDCEVIRAAHLFLQDIKVLDKVILKINTIGKTESRSIFIKEIKNFFNNNKNRLSQESLNRLNRNPLRILDSKDRNDQILLKDAPLIYDFLSKNELDNFNELKQLLNSIGIEYKVDPFLVRGLDYYSDTTFEFTLKENQKYAILAGGRYNDLVKELGGENIPGIGWAAGIERLENLVTNSFPNRLPILLVPTDKKYLSYAFNLSKKLYCQGVINQIIDNFNLKKSLKYANKMKVKEAIILGDYEYNNSLITHKDLESGKQITINEKKLLDKITK